MISKGGTFLTYRMGYPIPIFKNCCIELKFGACLVKPDKVNSSLMGTKNL